MGGVLPLWGAAAAREVGRQGREECVCGVCACVLCRIHSLTWDIVPSSRTYALTELGCHAGLPDNVTPLGLVSSSYRTSDQSSFPRFVLIYLRPRLSLWSKLPPNVTGSGSSGGSTF